MGLLRVDIRYEGFPMSILKGRAPRDLGGVCSMGLCSVFGARLRGSGYGLQSPGPASKLS